ncbi:MAG: ABC transporter ATP-binding protein [Ruminococcaceae bacterium]|nr:ABC transporter ATP-binding protein [Oscillospiraceae bacterium]
MKKLPVLWILRKLRRRIPAILLLVAAHAGQALASVYFALGTRAVIDSAVSGDNQLFFRACLQQLGIIAVILLCTVLARHLHDRLTMDLEIDWKRKLLHGLLHGDYAAISRYHSAELLNRLNNDVARINGGVLTILPNFAAMITRLLAAVLVLGAMDAKFTLLIAVIGVVVIGMTAVVRRKLKDLNKQVSQHDGKVSGFLQESMEKLLMVQAMDVSAEVERRADELMEDRYKIQRKRKNISLISHACIRLMSHGSAFFALIWCANRVLLGQMSFGSLTAITSLVGQLQQPFTGLSGVMPQYMAMIASAERLMELEEILGEPVEPCQSDIYEKMHAVGGENLVFSYDRDLILDDASFTLRKGEFAVIAGHSGIGKSTLLKLLLGVFSPKSGCLYVDVGEEKIPLDRTTRGLFAYVPQGNLLLSGTLRDNIIITNPDATDEQIAEAIRVSAMDDFLPSLPEGLQTRLGESGAGLSEGQAQRLAIARAVVSGAPILLLDECTSALDEATERKVLQNLKALPGRTYLAVTHRPAAMELCDWKLEIRAGKIVTEKM